MNGRQAEQALTSWQQGYVKPVLVWLNHRSKDLAIRLQRFMGNVSMKWMLLVFVLLGCDMVLGVLSLQGRTPCWT